MVHYLSVPKCGMPPNDSLRETTNASASQYMQFSAPLMEGETESAPSTTGSYTSSAAMVDGGALPRSVRGAPPELRRLIRKKQNADSARRCRRKLKMERERVTARNAAPPLSERVEYLEQMVMQLESRLRITEARYNALLARVAPPPAPPSLPHSHPSHSPHPSHLQVPPPIEMIQHSASTSFTPALSVQDGGVPTHIELPCDLSMARRKSKQPLSPTAINIPNYFTEALMPSKRVPVVEDRDACEQRTQFASTVDELALL